MRAPTLPTPTTLRAACAYRYRSSSRRRSPGSVARYERIMVRTNVSRCSCSAPGSTSSIGVISGGRARIRGSPSTNSHSFVSARRLSFFAAAVMFCSKRLELP